MQTVLIAGGTGFTGKHLISYLVERNYSVRVLTRKPIVHFSERLSYFAWDVEKEFIDQRAFEGVDVLINLTGANIGEKRWTERRKKEIIDSRIQSINLLYRYISENRLPIKTFISSSAVGYYGAVTTSKTFVETDKNARDFLGSVCQQWEMAAQRFTDLGIQTLVLRKGVVLGNDGGMIQKLSPLARLGVNVSLGTGTPYLPWIDIRDLVRLYEFILSQPSINGIFNVVSDEHITLNDFSKTFIESFGKTRFLPNTPAFILRLALGEMAVMVLEGSKVSNIKLKQTGFTFQFNTLNKSLNT